MKRAVKSLDRSRSVTFHTKKFGVMRLWIFLLAAGALLPLLLNYFLEPAQKWVHGGLALMPVYVFLWEWCLYGCVWGLTRGWDGGRTLLLFCMVSTSVTDVFRFSALLLLLKHNSE